jgi:hypothetical protein
VNVIGDRFLADEDHLLAFSGPFDGMVRAEDDLSGRRARGGGQAFGQHGNLCPLALVEPGREQL